MDEALTHKFNLPKLHEKAIQELQGIAAMIIYDERIDNSELEFLEKWLLANDEYLYDYPLADLKELFNQIMEDRIATKDERLSLVNFLTSIANSPEGDTLPQNIFTEDPNIIFEHSAFVVTGEFIFATRAIVKEQIQERKGSIVSKPSSLTNYLIVGDMGSDNYKFGKFGRKIETAININNSGKALIQIVREKDFIKAIIDNMIN